MTLTVSPATASSHPNYKRANGLTAAQHEAVDLVLTGATDQFIADTLGLSRSTITRWRNYDPYFKAALTSRRRARWAGAADSLRGAIPLALDTLRDQLRVGQNRGRLALDLLNKAGLLGAPAQPFLAGLVPEPSQDEDVLVDQLLDSEVRRRRADIHAEDPDDELGQNVDGPVSSDEREAALMYLLQLAGAPEDPPATDHT